jgi:hypothetical protein
MTEVMPCYKANFGGESGPEGLGVAAGFSEA